MTTATPPRRGLTEQAADAAARQQQSYRAFLAELLLAECDDRARRRSERRIQPRTTPEIARGAKRSIRIS